MLRADNLRAGLLAGVAMLAVQAAAQVEFVDPTIGNVGILLEPTRPAVFLPNSMVRVYPKRADALDDRIESFPLTISSHRMDELFSIMPGQDSGAAYDQEKATPYYYSTRFDDSLIQTEFTATERCGYFRFTFPDGKASIVMANRMPGNLETQNGTVVSGEERFSNMKAFVFGEFSAPVTFQSEDLGDRNRVIVTSKSARTLEFRYGISFISVEQAKSNLRHEIPAWDFEHVKDAAKARWNHVLGRIAVEGGTESERKVFYTALYRCIERMVNITEDGRYFSAFDHQVHEDKRPFYVDNWLWDTFRALEPLQTLLNPEMEADKIQSYVRMYQQSGIMPTFAILTGPYACMNGNHAAPWFADAWFKGAHNFDLQTAFDGVRKRSLEGTLLPWRLGPKGPLDEFYAEHGYMPALRPGEKETDPRVHPFEKRQPVPVTLENSFDDWSTADLDQLFREPLGRSKYEFQAKFPDSTSMVGQFSMGNEPSLAIPYIYNRLGAPWKTQKRVRMLLESFFTDTLQGMPGDEDGGGMSAFVVFSMMGFYPVTPGIPTYDIGSPVFDKTTIHLSNGKDFVIVAHQASHENKYVQSVRLNGKPLDQVWFRHADIANGGTLELTMGDTPNTSLGTATPSFPPASMSVHPEDYE
jgi:putative alpha-1,2-mannosidase